MTPVPNPLVPKLKPGEAKTVGISPKAIGAAIYPAFATLITTALSGLMSGNFNKGEFIIAAVGAGASVFAAIGAALSKPGVVVTTPPVA